MIYLTEVSIWDPKLELTFYFEYSAWASKEIVLISAIGWTRLVEKNDTVSNSIEMVSALSLEVCKIITVAAGHCFDSVLDNSEQQQK